MSAATACALPLPIQNGVLTGPLNANGQGITNVAGVTFADGTTLSTASGAGGGGGVSGTATNLTGAATNQVQSLALAVAQQVVATNAVAVTVSNAPNATVILSGNGLAATPLMATASGTALPGGALLYDEAGLVAGPGSNDFLLFDP